MPSSLQRPARQTRSGQSPQFTGTPQLLVTMPQRPAHVTESGFGKQQPLLKQTWLLVQHCEPPQQKPGDAQLVPGWLFGWLS